MSSKVNTLPIISSRQAALNALKEIDEGRGPDQIALMTRWKKVNKGLQGGMRFNNTYVIAGLSGHGKSFLLNMIRKDFTDKTINGGYHRKFRQLHIAFEMTAADEVLRDVSGATKKSYADLISAYKNTEGRILSDSDYEEVKAYLKSVAELDIDYIEVTGTVAQLEATIEAYGLKHKDSQLIVSLDHTLLADIDKEKDEFELVSNLSKMFLRIRKKQGIMGIIIAQLNSDIEGDARISSPNRHFPIRKDLYGSKSIGRDADWILVIHSPEKLGILQYGNDKLDTKSYFFLHFIKVRKGSVGFVRFKDDLANGNFIETDVKVAA